jgi:hypothetical protein
LRYTAGNPISNPLINSCFDVWQRSTSIAASSTMVYTADRWNAAGPVSSAYTITRQVTNDTTNLPNIQYCSRVQRNSGNTVTGTFYFNQPIETANSIPYIGKLVTVSFYARAGANYSATSSVLNCSLISGTGTDQNYINIWTGTATAGSLAATLTTTWQRFSFQATVSSSATQITLPFTSGATGTAGANDYYEVTGVQIDIGSVALPVRRNGSTIQGELAACQRYYIRLGGTCVYDFMGGGPAFNTANVDAMIPLPNTLRTGPSAVDFSTLAIQSYGGQTITAVATLGFSNGAAGKNTIPLAIGVSGTPLTAGVWYRIFTNNSTSGYLGFSAEL